jgi:hypothetical protein
MRRNEMKANATQWTAAAAIPALAMAVAGPAAALPLVVRALGPAAAQYKPGQKLDAAAVLLLKAGDEVTVLSGNGTRLFRGPGRFSLASGSAAAAGSFSQLLTQKTERRARIGAVRGGGTTSAPPQPPGIWPLDVALSGTFCALDPAAISLWRANPATPVTLTVMRRGVPTMVSFAVGQATTPLPTDVGLVDGDVLTITGQPRPATLTVRLLPRPANLETLGEAMVGVGCQSQFERLATASRVPDAP